MDGQRSYEGEGVWKRDVRGFKFFVIAFNAFG